MFIDSKRFTWYGPTKEGIIDASDLALPPGEEPPLTITSTLRGNNVEFKREEILYHGGEVAGWGYRANTKHLTWRCWTLLVVND